MISKPLKNLSLLHFQHLNNYDKQLSRLILLLETFTIFFILCDVYSFLCINIFIFFIFEFINSIPSFSVL